MIAAAATAKSLQSCPTLCDPIDGSPPGSPVPGILQARTLERVAISFSNAWKWKVKGCMDCSLPGSSAHGIFQARVLQWGAIAFSEPHVTSGYHNGQHNCGTLWIVSSLWIYPCLLFLFIFVISNFRLHFRGPKLFSYSFLNSFLYFSLRSLHTG